MEKRKQKSRTDKKLDEITEIQTAQKKINEQKAKEREDSSYVSEYLSLLIWLFLSILTNHLIFKWTDDNFIRISDETTFFIAIGTSLVIAVVVRRISFLWK